MDCKTCQACGATYQRKGLISAKRFSQSKFCSLACASKAKTEAAAKLKAEAGVKLCRECGQSYSPSDLAGIRGIKRFKERKYCSKRCANQGLQRTIDSLYSQIRIDPVTGCHVWTGYLEDGYGKIRFKRFKQYVHRIIWEHANGPIPEPLELDHLCKNTACCNIEHLRAVTHRENTLASDNRAAINARKGHCPKCGGEYSKYKTGRRYCPPCDRQRRREYRRRRRTDPEYVRKYNEAQNRRNQYRYDNDPAFKAARLAAHKQWYRNKFMKEKDGD